MVFFHAVVRSDFVVLLTWSFSALFPVQISVGRGNGDCCWLFAGRGQGDCCLLVEVTGTAQLFAVCW